LRPTISIVVPVFNEEASRPDFFRRLVAAVDAADYSWEFLFVDDGSSDGTVPFLRDLAKRDPRVRCLGFVRNFGHQRALLAGIEHADGDAVIMMDGDLQHPPEVIADMLKAWESGYAVVQAVRTEAAGTKPTKSLFSSLYYRLFRFLADSDLSAGSADFRLISKAVVQEIRRLSETHAFLRGLIPWLGFRTIEVGYQAMPRYAGRTNYSTRKMVELALDGIFSFSIKPIRLCIFFGVFAFAASVAYLIYVLYVKFALQKAVPGWASILILMSFLQGTQFILMGILGEYIGRIYTETKRRPRYVIRERINFGS
jgi:dolichol-phosphate mannosyltransferase